MVLRVLAEIKIEAIGIFIQYWFSGKFTGFYVDIEVFLLRKSVSFIRFIHDSWNVN